MSRRDRIIFGRSTIKYENGYVKHFKGLDLEKIRTLLKEGLIDPEDGRYEKPTNGEFIEFLEDHPDPSWTVNGFVLLPADDPNSEVIIEGVDKDGALSFKEIVDFVNAFRRADEFKISEDGAYCWYEA